MAKEKTAKRQTLATLRSFALSVENNSTPAALRLEVSAAFGRPLQDSIAGPDNEALFEQAGTASWARIVWPRSAMV
jgi:hypothetical protein